MHGLNLSLFVLIKQVSVLVFQLADILRPSFQFLDLYLHFSDEVLLVLADGGSTLLWMLLSLNHGRHARPFIRPVENLSVLSQGSGCLVAPVMVWNSVTWLKLVCPSVNCAIGRLGLSILVLLGNSGSCKPLGSGVLGCLSWFRLQNSGEWKEDHLLLMGNHEWPSCILKLE